MGVITKISELPPTYHSSQESINYVSTVESEPETVSASSFIHYASYENGDANLSRVSSKESLYRHKKYIGSRKLQRIENFRLLQTLVENSEEDDDTDSILPVGDSPLTRLHTSFENMAIWQHFISLSEGDQKRYLDSLHINNSRNGRGYVFTQELTSSSYENSNQDIKFNAEERFALLDGRFRDALKKKRVCLELVSSLEKTVTDVFAKNPSAVYITEELSNYERLLLHAICTYNLLHSHSMNVCQARRTKVENKYKHFDKPSLPLYRCIMQKYAQHYSS